MKGAAHVLGVLDAEQRYQYIAKVLKRQKQLSRYWNVTWTILAGAGTAVNLTLPQLVDFDDPKDFKNFRASQYVSALKSGSAVISWSLLPLKIPELPEKQLAGQPVCKRLAIAEGLLRVAAKEQRRRRLFDHISGVLVNIAAFLYLYLDRDDLLGASLNGGFGLLASEVKVFTQPMGAEHALHAYKLGKLAAQDTRSWHIAARPLIRGGIVSVSMQF